MSNTPATAERSVRWWPLLLLFTLFASAMSGCDWRHPDPREPVIAPAAANDAKAASDAAASSDESSNDRRD